MCTAVRIFARLTVALAVLIGALPGYSQAVPKPVRFLLLVDASFSMGGRQAALNGMIYSLIKSGFEEQLRPGDQINLWTYNHQAYPKRYPAITWDADQKDAIAARLSGFLRQQSFDNHTRFENVYPDLRMWLATERSTLIFIFTDGGAPFSEIPFDVEFNSRLELAKEYLNYGEQPALALLKVENYRIKDWGFYSQLPIEGLLRLPEREPEPPATAVEVMEAPAVPSVDSLPVEPGPVISSKETASTPPPADEEPEPVISSKETASTPPPADEEPEPVISSKETVSTPPPADEEPEPVISSEETASTPPPAEELPEEKVEPLPEVPSPTEVVAEVEPQPEPIAAEAPPEVAEIEQLPLAAVEATEPATDQSIDHTPPSAEPQNVATTEAVDSQPSSRFRWWAAGSVGLLILSFVAFAGKRKMPSDRSLISHSLSNRKR